MSFNPTPSMIQRWFPSKKSEIAGNMAIVSQLWNFIKNGSCNALITGPSRTGKTRTILLWVKAFLCTNRTVDLDSCGKCDTCRMLGEARGAHYALYSRLTGTEFCYHPIDCEKVTADELDELEAEGELHSEKTIVYLDEVAVLRQRRLEGRLLKLIDETEATWIASAISVQRKKGNRKGEWTERLSKEMRSRFPIKIGTSLPHPDDLCQWIDDRCAEWNITIHDPKLTLPLIARRTDQRVGYVIHMLAFAATKSDRSLGPEEVKAFNLDSTD